MKGMFGNFCTMVTGVVLVYVFMNGKPSTGLVWFILIIMGTYLGINQWLKRRKKRRH